MKRILRGVLITCLIIVINFTIVVAQPISTFSINNSEETVPFLSEQLQLDIKTLENLEEIKKISITDTIRTFKTNKEIERKQKERTINPSFSASESELDMLAKIIYAEARGENYNGKVAVGAVIMNRIKSSKYPNTIREVIFAPKQFSPVSNGTYYSAKPGEAEYQAAKDALNGVDPTNGALTFYAYTYTYSAYHESMHHTATIGNHKFFR